MRRQDAAILAALQSQGLDQARLDDVAAQLEFTTWDLALRPFLVVGREPPIWFTDSEFGLDTRRASGLFQVPWVL